MCFDDLINGSVSAPQPVWPLSVAKSQAWMCSLPASTSGCAICAAVTDEQQIRMTAEGDEKEEEGNKTPSVTNRDTQHIPVASLKHTRARFLKQGGGRGQKWDISPSTNTHKTLFNMKKHIKKTWLKFVQTY